MRGALAIAVLAACSSGGSTTSPTGPSNHAPGSSSATWPTAVSTAWLEELDKKHQLVAAVDLQRGLVVLERIIDVPGEGAQPTVSARRLCGGDLERAAPDLEKAIIAAYRTPDVSVQCPVAGAPNVCTFKIQFEYSTATTLTFRDEGGKLALDSVMSLDAGTLEQSFLDEQTAWVSARMTELRASNCP